MRPNPESYFTENLVLPYVGVVEDVADPLQLGRVRVRAIGYHPEQADGAVPTEDLPWAHVLLPTTAAGVSGIGSTHGLVDGSWVFGYFLDGRDAMQPIVVGSFQGSPGASKLQKSVVNSGGAVASPGPGGVAGAFQTALASTVGSLGASSKFGALAGGSLDLVRTLANDEFLAALGQAQRAVSTLGLQSTVSQVVDRAALSSSEEAASLGREVPTGGLHSSLLQKAASVLPAVFSAGGALGAAALGPLASASLGSVREKGSQPTADSATVAVKTDFDYLASRSSEDSGLLVVYSTETTKDRSFAAADFTDVSGYDLVIDSTGHVVAGAGSSAKFVVNGSPASKVGIALVGGAGDGTMESKFWPVQLQVLEKLVGAYLRRFPSMRVAGKNELGTGGSPGFDVSEWAASKWPDNVNTTQGGQKVVTGKTTSTAGASGFASWSPGSYTDDLSGLESAKRRGAKRGFQGGPSRPSMAYAALREPDVPAMARTNALTVGRGRASQSDASGGPGQQYLAQVEEPSMHSFQTARKADTMEARAVPETWRVPKYPHGGEYNQAHVVRATEGGQHVLLDDTPGRQKVELMHSSGSMLQVQADGSGLFYLKKDGYEVVLGDKKVGVSGSMDLSVGGDLRVSVKGDMAWDVTGKVTINGASDMHEVVKGDRSSLTEGSHALTVKKNASVRAGKDLDLSSGGKTSTHSRGARHDVVDGNRSTTTRGESSEYVAGNKSSLSLGADTTHARNLVMQSTGELVAVAKGNAVLSARGRATVTSTGVLSLSSAGAVRVVSGALMNLTAGGDVDVRASGDVNLDGTFVNLNSGDATSAEGEAAADVDSAPAQLTRESNASSSDGNLDAEQTLRGGIDEMESTDDAKDGGTAPGSLNSSGGTGKGSDAFKPYEGGSTPVSPSSLGNYRESACGIANDLVARGWSKEGASAIVGNMINESSLNPSAYTIDVNGKPSGGLVQWNGSRFSALQSYAASRGLPWQSREAQVGFLDQEARGQYSGSFGGSGMINATDIGSAIQSSAAFERFVGWNNGGFTGGAWSNGNGNRAGNALGVYNECFGNDVGSVGGQVPSDVSGYTGGGDSSTGQDEYSDGTGEEGAKPHSDRGPYVTGGAVDWGRKVSPHFTLGQMCPTSHFHAGMNASGRGNISSDTLIKNLSGVAMNVVEPLLSHYGRVTVMSGYRSQSYNAKVGGAKNSDHMTGQAVDIIVPGTPAADVANWVERNIPSIAGIGRYPRHRPPFTHVSYYLTGNGGRIRRW